VPNDGWRPISGRIAENSKVFDFKLDADDLKQIDTLDTATGRIGPDPMTAAF
jgi:2,5-diketo-D-gluconate reductase A